MRKRLVPDLDETDVDVEVETDGDRPVASIQRALSVLDAFREGEATLTMAELAERTGLPRNTVARILATLEPQGYIVRERSGEFHIGPKPLRLANRFQLEFPCQFPAW